MRSYSLETEKVSIDDCGYAFVVKNKTTGKTVAGKNHCGFVNRKMIYAMRYDEKPVGLCHQECGKANGIAFALKRLGLPTFRTLERGARA